MSYYKTFYDKYVDKMVKLHIAYEKQHFPLLQDILTQFMNLKRQKTCAFDLEFSQVGGRKIAIIQFALYFDNEIIILFVNPRFLPNNINNIIRNMFTDTTITKIGHGTDSLDIPAIYEFLNDRDKCLQFTSKLYDTRFMCEFIKALTNDKLCNIYQCMIDFKVIDKQQLKFLVENEKNLGKFWWKSLDIRQLNSTIIDYAMYDALYLKNLTKKIKMEFEKQNLDYNLLLECSRFSILIQQKIIIIQSSNKFNTYRAFDESLIDLFETFYNYKFDELNISYKKILSFGYFKNRLLSPLKILFYNILSKNTTLINTKRPINNNDMKELQKLNEDMMMAIKPYPRILQMFNQICQDTFA